MSDELRLPDDLAACEARLAAQSLPATAINRDELLYRAGWAACEARVAASAPPLSTVEEGPRRRGARGGIRLAAASLTSAAVAASLAVVITLQWRPTERLEVADDKPAAPTLVAADTSNTKPPLLVGRESKPPALRELSAGFETGLLSLRRRALSSVWMEPTNVVSTNGGSPPAAKTARELMQEMLPSEPARSTPLWPWITTPRGESI